jgi:hypoxanthine phosphoribosyltransferase
VQTTPSPVEHPEPEDPDDRRPDLRDRSPVGSVRAHGRRRRGGLPGRNSPDEYSPDPDREVLSWELFGTAVRELAETIVGDGFVPELVLGIARGGLPIAGGLAYALGAKMVGTLNVEFYTGVDTTLDEPMVLPPLLDLDALRGSRVLIVDDVADSGRTLEVVVALVAGHVAESRVAVLYHKPSSVVVPRYAWRSTDRWIVFPWSALPPVAPDQ